MTVSVIGCSFYDWLEATYDELLVFQRIGNSTSAQGELYSLLDLVFTKALLKFQEFLT